MMRKRWTTLFSLPLLFLVVGAQSSVPMYMPPPIAVPAGTSLVDISKVIQQVVMGRGFVVNEQKLSEGESTSEIKATLSVRVHTLTIQLTFDTEKIQIQYVDSTNLGYREATGGKYIHPKYKLWIQNLERDLGVRLFELAK